MYLMYVDESGDSGMAAGSSQYFVLTGLVVHELNWQTYLNQILLFRRRMHGQYGLGIREEIHSSAMINRPGSLVRIPKYDRLAIIRHFANELSTMSDINIINVIVDKQGKSSSYDVFEMAWTVLLQRFENTLVNRNFPGPKYPDERGMVFPDHTDDKKLTALLRKLRRYNPIPNQPAYGPGYRNIQITSLIEDPTFRDSMHSYFIQAVDLAAYLLFQHTAPNRYMKKTGGQAYFQRLGPILCRVASSRDPNGVVRL